MNYLAPGVYVQEIPGGTRPIGQVGTSSAGFVGVAPDAAARVGDVVPVDNWTEFLDTFVGDVRQGGNYLANAVYGFFRNGGGRCYVVNIGANGSLTGTAANPGGLTLLEPVGDVAIVAAPGMTGAVAYDALLSHCEDELRQDRVAILDTVERVDDIEALTRVGTEGVPAPEDKTAEGEPAAPNPGRRAEQAFRPRQSPGGYGTLYYPWVVVADPITGIWCRSHRPVTSRASGHGRTTTVASTRRPPTSR